MKSTVSILRPNIRSFFYLVKGNDAVRYNWKIKTRINIWLLQE
jgi:hypothetical protein